MSHPTLLIRDARPEDAEVIAAFNARLAQETEHLALDMPTLRRGVEKVLADAAKGRYFVAVAGDEVVGCTMVTYEWSDWRDANLWWIQSVYVVPERRCLGVFRAMHNHILAKARADSRACGIRLYVERQNRTAQTVYQSVGLTPSAYTVFEQDFVLGHEVHRKQPKEFP